LPLSFSSGSQCCRSGQIGVFGSHVHNWMTQQAPVVTVESDTDPVRSISELPQACMQYDLVALHNYPSNESGSTGQCPSSNSNSEVAIVDGTGFAMGAYLWTGRRALSSALLSDSRCLDATGKMAQPIDHWLNCMHDHGILRIGHACPAFFHQRLGQTHGNETSDDSLTSPG
jgi:hypothetical protein